MNRRTDRNKISFFSLLTYHPSLFKAFTLAEIIITLGIISVMAVIMINSVQQYQKYQYASGLKKAYSTLSQATINAINTDGPVGTWTVVNDTAGINRVFLYFEPYLNIIKDCGNSQNGCWSETKTLGKLVGNYSYSYGLGIPIRVFTLSDGMNISLDIYGGPSALGVNGSNLITFAVDVNGNKGPNIMGWDVFYFVLTNNNGLVPAGKDNNSAKCVASTDLMSGYDCTAKVLKEDAINY